MPQGRRFGKYLLHDKLAVGGMGELYLATTVGAAKGTPPSVLKILLAEYSQDADFVSMFHDEARIGMQLAHGNIVAVQDLVQALDQEPVLVSREERVPLGSEHHLDHPPSRAAEHSFQLLNDLPVAPHRTVEANIATVPGLLGWDRRRTRARVASSQ